MPRRLLVAVALALLTASCSTSNVLATVNGEEITQEDLEALRPSYAANPQAVAGEALREDVSGLIILNATLQAAESEFDVVLDDATIQERLDNPPERYAQVLRPAIAAEDTDELLQRSLAIVTLLIDEVGPPLTAEEFGNLAELYASRPDIVNRVCVRHIQVATPEEGEDVKARLLAGEDFLELLAEVSTDRSTPDGLLVDNTGACPTWLSAIGGEFSRLAATAELNVPIGPIQTAAGFSVFRVEERIEPASIADLEADPMEYLELSVVRTVYSAWASDVVRNADVDVASALGRWSADGFGIAPPGE